MLLINKIISLFRSSHFSSYVFLNEDSKIFELGKMKSVYKGETSSLNLFNCPTTIADAFLYANANKMWLFYELQEHLDSKGLLMSVTTTDGINWSNPKIVLEESVHLSFPYVFEDKGDVYMMPETSFLREIRLYKGSNECTNFQYITTLLRGERYVDSCFYMADGVYYLFTSVQHDDNSYTLRLYTSNDLLGDWQEHPCSPISTGKYCERNAGAIIESDGLLLRPAQNNTAHYATNTHLYRIVELSPTRYREEPYVIDILKPGFLRNIGGHQFSVCTFKGKEYIAVDVLQRSFNKNALLKRLKQIFRK